MANLSVIVAFLFRISAEETATFSPKELESIVIFGAQPVRQRVQRDSHYPATVVGIETTTVVLDDFGMFPSTGRKDSGRGGNLEVNMRAKPGLLSDV